MALSHEQEAFNAFIAHTLATDFTREEQDFIVAAMQLVRAGTTTTEGAGLHLDAAYAMDNLARLFDLHLDLQDQVSRAMRRRG